ncbi:MAG: hypothetical protein ABIJ56_21310 [Pseudomonadota bacterium]
MKPAVIVVDMLEGNYRQKPERDGSREEEKIIIPVRDFLRQARKRSIPVIFACDSFLEDDFILPLLTFMWVNFAVSRANYL